MPCFLAITPAGIIPFVRDILCLILKLLNCLIDQLQTLAELMGGLTIQLEAAKKDGNQEMVESLECSQENAALAAAHLLGGLGPIGAILDLAGPLLSIAGAPAITLPQIGSDTDAEALNTAIESMKEVVGTINGIADTFGGC